MQPSEMIASSPIAAIISNPRLPDNPIVECNAAFLALTGYTREEVIGRNCRFLAGPATEDQWSNELRRAIRARRPALVEILNYRKDGTPFRNAVMIAPIFDARGDLEYFLGSQIAVEVGTPVHPTRHEAARARIDALSDRQRVVLLHLADGKLNKQIAHALALTERTVKMHRSALFRALDVRTAAEAIRLAIEAGY